MRTCDSCGEHGGTEAYGALAEKVNAIKLAAGGPGVLAGTLRLPGVLRRRSRPGGRTAAEIRLIVQAIKETMWPKERRD
jgi:hypothetical protein